jgi:hypothetical protein
VVIITGIALSYTGATVRAATAAYLGQTNPARNLRIVN